MNVSRSLSLAIILVGLLGCGGKIERIDIAIPSQSTGASVSDHAFEIIRVTVLPFEDKRANQVHLGYRSHFWGGLSVFKSSSGDMTEATARALVDYLNRQGWQASLASTAAHDGVDVTITGSVEELSIDATSGFMHTDLFAKNTLMLYVKNHSDGSIVSTHVLGKGSDQVFWFEPKDAQALTTELFEKNFQKFLGDIRIEGRAIRLR